MSLVTLAEAKAMVQIAHTDEDVLLQILLDGAEEFVQRYCSLFFDAAAPVATTHIFTTEKFQKNLFFPSGPVDAVTAITDEANDDTLLSASLYKYDSRKVIYYNANWPVGEKRWKVAFTRGYTAATLPTGLKVAILHLVARGYENRGEAKSQSVVDAQNTVWGNVLNHSIGQELRVYQQGKSGRIG